MTLRTRVYVDGYNLYYGCVRKTAYKWLDICALAAQILATIRLDVDGAPATFDLDPLAIKYFTAAILKNFARHEDSVPSQGAPGSAWSALSARRTGSACFRVAIAD
jgi:6-hydroxy-3-succinoylpyridine 3-monooxygenase